MIPTGLSKIWDLLGMKTENGNWKFFLILLKLKLGFLFRGNYCFHRGLGGSIGVISLFYASYWIHIMLCKGEKNYTLSNLDEKGVTEVTPNQGDPYCPECL